MKRGLTQLARNNQFLKSRFYSTITSNRLGDKVAVITGAGAGIGLQTALKFADNGAKVVAVDLNETAANECVEQIKARGGDAIAFAGDVANAQHSAEMVAIAEKTYGKLNVMFNNAGISHAEDDNCETTTEEVFDLTMKINVTGVFLGCKNAIPALRRAGGGSIINTASFVATLGAATPQIAYTASKGAVLSMTRELATIHAREGIRVNALAPGPLKTELLMKYLDTPEKLNRRLVHCPQGRFGTAEEIADSVVFLASDESTYITGANFLVDGGITAAYVTPE